MIVGLGGGLYADLGVRFGIDLAAILLVALVFYVRRHKRRDLFLAYTFFNVGLFVALGVITATTITVGVGFGLFALLSIVRLRSEPFTNLELGYLFIALVLGLINGLSHIDRPYVLLLNLVVLSTAFVVDHPRLNPPVHYRTVALDFVCADGAALKEELERRFGVEILELLINDVDYVREVTRIGIRYVDRQAPIPPQPATAMMFEPVPAKDGDGNAARDDVRLREMT